MFASPAAPEATAAPPQFELRPSFAGRARELETLVATYEAVERDRALGFALVLGEPGMGKTRLLREATRRIAARAPEVRVLFGAGDGRGAGHTAFARLLGGRVGITPSDSGTAQREKILAGVAEVLPAARVTEVAHLLAHLMRVPFPDSPVLAPLVDSPQQLEARTYIALRRFLAADANAGPLVLCLENLELCGTETINLLHYLAAGLRSAPVLMLCTARELLYDRHPSFGDTDVPLAELRLGPLDDHEAGTLLRELCRPLGELPDRLVRHAAKLRGSPRAIYELVRYLLEANVIVPDDADGWTIDRGRLALLVLPEDHAALTAARLAAMPEPDRDLLDKAAAVGETFWLDAVVALVRAAALQSDAPDGPTLAEIATAGDRTRVTVAQGLARLAQTAWIVEVAESSAAGEREYQFAYPPLWSAAYGSIDEAKRRASHRVVAHWLELRPGGRRPVAQEDIGRHLELSGDVAAAAACYRRAADAARHSFFNARAIKLYGRALTCLGETDLAARIHLWHDLGSVYELKGEFDAALGAFERMLRLSWVVATRSKAAGAFNKMGRVWRRKGDLKLALEYLSRSKELFEQAADERGVAASLDDIGQVLYLLGRYDEAYERVTRALAARSRDGEPRSIAESLSNLGNIQKERGRFAEARNCHSESLELRRGIGDRAGVVGSLNNLAVLAFEVGDLEGARSGWEQALQEAEQIGALPLQALALTNLGELARIQGRSEEARRRLDEALALAEDIDDRRLQSEALRNLALLAHTGGDDDARDHAERALELARVAGLRDNEGRCLLALAEVVGGNLFDADMAGEPASTGRASSAETYYRRGIDLLRDIGNDSELAKGLELFGRHKIERGDLGSGSSLLREALAIFDRLGMKRRDDVERVLTSL
jgi:tetratricopeptide (TPR) repeat protein